MTGFESKRKMAKNKLDDDDAQGYIAEQQAEPCVGKDPLCPCQDGDACHYKDCGITKARPVPLEQPEQEPVISAWSAREVYFDEDGEPVMHRSPPATEPEQEPVAYYHPHKGFYWAKPTHISAPTAMDVPPVPLYVKWKAAQRPWQGLTDEEVAIASAEFDLKLKLAFHAGMYKAQIILRKKNDSTY